MYFLYSPDHNINKNYIAVSTCIITNIFCLQKLKIDAPPQKRLSPEAVSLLLSCSWPGNIKQLQGVIEQAFFHTPGSIIEAENIKLPGDKTLERSWKYDKEAFIAAWKSAGGNISKLATMLDVSRVTLYRYLKKYGLGPKNK